MKITLYFVRLIWFVLLFISMIFAVIGVLVDNNLQIFLSIASFIIMCLSFIFLFIFWKCPSCDRHLPFQGSLGMKKCPYCGNDLGL